MTRRNRALEKWSPEDEEREFHTLVGERYIANCLETRTDADREALAASVDGLVERYFQRQPSGRAVDVGAGEGWATLRLRELGFDAVGVERSPQVAARAPEGSVLVGNAERLPLEDSSQDFVLCNSIFEHVRDPERVIREVARVMKPGAVCVLSTTNRWHWRTGEIDVPLYPYLPYRVRERLWYRSGRRHITPHYFSYGDLRRMARANGLRCQSPLEVEVPAGRQRTRRGRIAQVLLRVPGVHVLLEATIPVVQVRLVKPGVEQ